MQDVGKVEVLAVERGWRGRRLLHVLVLWRLLLLLLTLLLVLLLSLASKAGKVSQHRDGKARGAGDVEEVVRSKVSKLYCSLVLKDATFVRSHHDQTNNITVTGVTPRLMPYPVASLSLPTSCSTFLVSASCWCVKTMNRKYLQMMKGLQAAPGVASLRHDACLA